MQTLTPANEDVIFVSIEFFTAGKPGLAFSAISEQILNFCAIWRISAAWAQVG
tara:strand:+ start:187 stop:345 length:159 start_codon:yes stop_codon:yes gene_type:complete